MIRVLVNAYAVSPNRGSEPGMGWNWCVRLAKECELFIITEGEFREEIERVVSAIPDGKNMHFFYLPTSDRVRRMCWHQGDWRFYVHYRRWQKRALALAREICSKHQIDIIHQLNMIGFREPGFLWQIPEIPYVLGPMNCKFEYPLAYWKDAPWVEWIQVRLKDCISRLQIRFSPRVRHAVRRASVFITASSDAQRLFKKYLGIDSIMMNETGASPYSRPLNPESHEGLDVLWVGRLNLYSKLPELALRALARVENQDIRLHFVGPGDNSSLRRLAERLGVGERCRWLGEVSHSRVNKLMGDADVLLFTSVVEGTPHVVLESISNGCPVVCFDTCGQGDIVDENVGIKIPLSNPRQSELDFASALTDLYNNPVKRAQMSKSCKNRSEELSWDEKVARILSLYVEVCNHS